MSQPTFQHAAIIGVGLIGGSIARALRERGLAERVVGISRSKQSAERVLTSRAVTEATADLAEGCEGADLVVVCTPVDTIASHLLEVAKHAAPGALLTDAGSTKATIVAEVEKGLAQGEDGPKFIGSHPLAGDHRTGPEAARPDLFNGAVTILTPSDKTPADAIDQATACWESLGSRVITMTPERHDAALAITSHLPHVAAAAVASTTPADLLSLVATGWADTTRVAAGSPVLWREILLANREAVGESLETLIKELSAYAEAIDHADGEALTRLLEEGKQRRDALGS